MSEDTFLFIDGASFRRLLDSTRGVYGLGDNFDIDYTKLVNSKIRRAFFYDAYPIQKRNQTDAQYEAEYKKTVDYFNLIGSTSNFHVRHGESRFRKKRGSEQKAVDIMLALDAYRHASKENMDRIILVTNDLDFCPLFEALLETRVRTELWYEKSKTSSLLIDAADHTVEINEAYLTRFFPNNVAPQFIVSLGPAPEGPMLQEMGLLQEISIKNEPFRLYRDDRNKNFVGVYITSQNRQSVRSKNFHTVRLWSEIEWNISLSDLDVPENTQF